ncbi:MAG: host attachment protein [Endozoicomonas sp.]
MPSCWVLFADDSQARFYQFDRNKHELKLVDYIDHKEGRWKNHDFVSSALGMSICSFVGRSARLIGTDNFLKAYESISFAHMLVKSVNYAHELHQFEILRVCTPSGFLGELFPLISSHVPLGEHINKDLIHESTHELLKHLTELH